MLSRRKTFAPTTGDGNPLVAVVEPFDHRTRQLLYAATNTGDLRRSTWNGCALNRAAAELELTVKSRGAAARAFGTSRRAVSDFIAVWDGHRGSDDECTEALRDALLQVGLFPTTGSRRTTPTTGGGSPDAAGDELLTPA
jgi:hypothetical protein